MYLLVYFLSFLSLLCQGFLYLNWTRWDHLLWCQHGRNRICLNFNMFYFDLFGFLESFSGVVFYLTHILWTVILVTINLLVFSRLFTRKQTCGCLLLYWWFCLSNLFVWRVGGLWFYHPEACCSGYLIKVWLQKLVQLRYLLSPSDFVYWLCY